MPALHAVHPLHPGRRQSVGHHGQGGVCSEGITRGQIFLYRITITLNLLFLSMDEPITTTATTSVNGKKLTLGDIGLG